MSGQRGALKANLAKTRQGEIDHFLIEYWQGLSELISQKILDHAGGRRCALDVGCGKGTYLRMLAKHGVSSYGIDPFVDISLLPARALDREEGVEVEYLQAVGESIPFQDSSFDLVLCLSTLQHVDDQKAVVHEIRRVLCPNGVLICHVPTYRNLQTMMRWVPAPDYVTRRFDLPSFIDLFESCGLEIEEISTPGLFPPLGFKAMQRVRPMIGEGLAHRALGLSYALGETFPKLASNVILVCSKRPGPPL